jgi:hypothetical protein
VAEVVARGATNLGHGEYIRGGGGVVRFVEGKLELARGLEKVGGGVEREGSRE